MANPNVVTVKITPTPATGTPTSIAIELDKDPFFLGGQGTGGAGGTGAPIIWNIDAPASSNWVFAGTGIAIAAPPGRFDAGALSQSDQRYTCNRLNADNNTYKYSISVTNGSLTITIDPSIINQP